jgi:hypothetical protein
MEEHGDPAAAALGVLTCLESLDWYALVLFLLVMLLFLVVMG